MAPLTRFFQADGCDTLRLSCPRPGPWLGLQGAAAPAVFPDIILFREKPRNSRAFSQAMFLSNTDLKSCLLPK